MPEDFEYLHLPEVPVMDDILDLDVDSPAGNEYADFARRLFAAFLDWMMLFFINLIFQFLVGSLEIPVLILVFTLSSRVFYYAILESSESQGTMGKIAMGIKVGDAHGRRISFGTALLRYFGKIPSTIILFLGFLMASWDDRGQALHDKIAGTFVFRK